MTPILREVSKNVHELYYDYNRRNLEIKIAMLSDLHWDNPKCDWVLLKKHLDYCLKNNIRIHLNGDTFCLMQGWGDPRSNKDSIRPEHNNNTYLDSVINTAIEWFAPYANLIDVVGYGNHCTSVLKRRETDVLKRFVEGLNLKTGSNIFVGGYGGWYIIRIRRAAYKIKYFHGSGGGGIVTKGHINLTRAMEMYEGFDCFTMGHVHENTERYDVRDTLDGNNKQISKEVLLMITGTYKEEYNSGINGWHVERGAPAKPIGGRLLTLTYKRNTDDSYSIKGRSQKM